MRGSSLAPIAFGFLVILLFAVGAQEVYGGTSPGLISAVTPTPTPLESVNQDWRAVLQDLPQEEFSPPPLLVCPDVNHCWVSAWTSQRATVSTPVVAKTTSDGGNTWIPWEVPGLPVITAAAFLDASFGYAGSTPLTSNGRHYNSQGLARTRDGGQSWQIVAGLGPDRIYVVNRAVAYVTEGGGTYKTTDGGDTWRGGLPMLPYSTQFLDEKIAWSIVDFTNSSDHHLQFTIDGGQSWTTVVPEDDDPNTAYASLFFLNYQEGWVGSAGRLLHTTDAGQTWEKLASPSWEDPHLMVFLTPRLGWIEGGGWVYRTIDGGHTWQYDHSSSFFTLAAVNDFDHGWGVTVTQVWKRAPGLALTPTATATPAPGTTPTATRTPFAPPIPTATAIPTPCSWTGQWDTTAGGGRFAMALSQSGSSVVGTYGTEPRQITGTTAASALSGRWAGPPSYQEPQNAGRFVFVMAFDCNSFTGSWGFNQSATDGGVWSGTRTTVSPERAQLVTRLYRELLCRGPDPEGLATWAGSSATEAQLRTAIGGSAEGQQAAAVRSLYLATFGRDPVPGDCGGLRGWVDSGLGVGEIRAGLEGSPEGLRVRAIRDLYIELLGRDPLGPDNAGLRSWAESGLSLEEIRQGLTASAEYQHKQAG